MVEVWRPIETAPRANDEMIIGMDADGEVQRVFYYDVSARQGLVRHAWIDRHGDEWDMRWWIPEPIHERQREGE